MNERTDRERDSCREREKEREGDRETYGRTDRESDRQAASELIFWFSPARFEFPYASGT